MRPATRSAAAGPLQGAGPRCKRPARYVSDTGAVVGSTFVRVLGGPSVERGGSACPVGGPKAQQLLCVLVAHRGQVVSTDRLVDALWDEHPPPSVIATIQSQVSRLRALLGPEFPIDRTGGGYRLDASCGGIDADRFESQLQHSSSLDDLATVAALESALDSWRGPAFAGHAHLAEVRGEAVRLDELRLVAMDAWAEAGVACGDPARMVGELEALVRAHPLREHYWRLLMLALHRSGRQAEALRRSAELRNELRHAAGLDLPSTIQDLEHRILSDDPDLLVGPVPPSRSRVRSVGVPQLLGATSFIGRDPEVSATVAALHMQPLVTVTGPGGVGKTRLAMRVAAAYLDHVEDGVTVVEFAPLRDSGGVAQVIANALDIQQRQYRTVESTIEEYLADTDRLLALDNCEHLTEAIAPLVDRLRSACPRLRTLTTSREPLGLAGEYVVQLAPLPLPPTEPVDTDTLRRSNAVELFVSRADAATPGFTLTADNAAAVASICRRLEGLPLALELAAARLRTMGVEALAARLRERVGSMSQTQRGADGRHRTLHDVVAWSHALLQPDEQHMFEELSVFAGGFDLPAVESVCGTTTSPATLDTLVNLVDKSMVVFVDPTGPRYRLLEPLREFGRDRLHQHQTLEVTENRHLAWFRDLAEQGSRGIDGPNEPQWSRILDQNADNLRAAHATALRRGDTDSAMQIIASLREHAFRRIRYELVAWAEDTLVMPDAMTHPLARTALAVTAYGRFVTGDMKAAIELAHQALADQHGDGRFETGLAERVLGNACFYLGRTQEALHWMDAMVATARRSGNDARLAHALYMRSVAETSVGNPVQGAVLAGEARAAADASRSPTACASAAYALGLALEATDPTTAREHLERASRTAAEAGNRWIEAFSLTEVHWLQGRHGEHTTALEGFATVIDTWYRGGDWANQWLSLRRVLALFIDMGAYESAATLHGALSAVGASHALPFEPADADRLRHSVDHVRSTLGPATYAAAVRRGASMPDPAIVDFARSQIDALTTNVSTHPTPAGSDPSPHPPATA